MSNSDRENWTIDDWRNYALELERILERKPKKRGAPRKHPKELVGAVIYRMVEAKLEGNKLTAKEALADELEKQGKGRWRAKECLAVINDVSKRKDLRDLAEKILIRQKEINVKQKEVNERLKLIEDTNRRHEARRPCLADAIGSEFLRVKKS